LPSWSPWSPPSPRCRLPPRRSGEPSRRSTGSTRRDGPTTTCRRLDRSRAKRGVAERPFLDNKRPIVERRSLHAAPSGPWSRRWDVSAADYLGACEVRPRPRGFKPPWSS
jgi:hypothetical protein